MKYFVILLLFVVSCSDEPQQKEDSLLLQEIEVASLEMKACDAKMSQDLEKTFPWLKWDVEFDQYQSYTTRNQLDANAKSCIDQRVQEYLSEWYKTCSKHRCGDNTGGGCAHLDGLRSGIPQHNAMLVCVAEVE